MDREAEQASRETGEGRTMAALLAHPLVLLVVTALLSGLLVPRLTQQWQNHQQQIDTRREFAARVSRTVGEIFIASQLAQIGAPSQSQDDFDAAYVRWEIESAVLGAELRAYYTDESVHMAWDRCSQLATAYYAQVGIAEPARRAAYLQEIHDHLALSDEVDLGDIDVLRTKVLSERDLVINEVLDSPMK